MNTIDKKLDRGMLDQDAAAAMKRLAKRKMQQAIRDVAYAQGSYAAEMEQTALLAEAKAEMKRYEDNHCGKGGCGHTCRPCIWHYGATVG